MADSTISSISTCSSGDEADSEVAIIEKDPNADDYSQQASLIDEPIPTASQREIPVDPSPDSGLPSTSDKTPTLSRKRTSRSFRNDNYNAVFKKLPGLDKYHPYSSCRRCGTTIKTTELLKLLPHVRSCKKIDHNLRENILKQEESIPVANSKTEILSNELNSNLAQTIIRNNIPLRILDCPLFRATLTKAEPRWSVATRASLCNRLIPFLARKAKEDFELQLKISGEYCLSIEFDHWQDISQRQILAIVATLPDGKRFLLKLEDVSLKGHTTVAIVASLMEGLHSLPSVSINAIMSDSASSCKAARESLVGNASSPYTHVIQYRCMAHFINTIGNRITSDEEVSCIFLWANRLVNYVTRGAINPRLNALGSKKLCKPSSVRWYSNVDMLKSLSAVRANVITIIEREKLPRTDESVSFIEEVFWEDSKKILQILEPLVSCIAVSERADSPLGESMRALLDFAKSLFSSDLNRDYVVVSIKAFLNYFSIGKLGEDEFGLMLTAYCLDRRNNLNYLTKKALKLVFQTLAKIALRSGVPTNSISELLIDEFEKFKRGRGIYSKLTSENEPAADWWRNLPDIGLLRKLASRVSNLKSSSANTERVFSMLKFMQSPARTRFSIESLEAMARAKLAMVDSDDIEPFSFMTEEHRIFDDDSVPIETAASSTQRSNSSSSLKRGRRGYGVRLSKLASKIAKMVSRVTNPQEQRASQCDLFQDPRVKELHISFCSYIDFEIVNAPPQLSPYPQLENEDSSSILKNILSLYCERQGGDSD